MAEPKSYPMTAEALEGLREELAHKIEVERPALAARLKSAIEMGDLSENADYITAKEEQGFLEGRIQLLQVMIQGAEIIEKADGYDSVQLGSHVTVVEDGEDETEVFHIVGMVEANPRAGKISEDSPMGKALMGARIGDVVRVEAPAGQIVFKVVDLS